MVDVLRCEWAKSPHYHKYHDEEWGVPVHDDNKHFEFLVLEGMQAGLSWLVVLNKRENFRKAFSGFDPKKVSKFDNQKIESLIKNEGIIRNRLKIKAAVTNAKRFLEVQNEFGTFDKYIWSFVAGKPMKNKWKKVSQIPTISKEARELSKNLKKRGFKFVGPTIMYAHMQAIGMVNDHTVDCFRYDEV